MFRLITYSFFICSAIVLNSCGIPSVKSPVKRQLVIASDFLNHRDISLFKGFAREHNTVVHILHLPVDSILGKLSHEGYTTRIDVVLLRSSLDLCRFRKAGQLQMIPDPEERPALPYRYRDGNNYWFGIAMDPYIIVEKRDSVRRIRNYSDLGEGRTWTTTLKDDNELTALFTPILHRYRKEANKVLESFSEKMFLSETRFSRPTDSTYSFPPLLTRYSVFYSDSSLYRSGYRKAEIIFPGQKKGGVFYELRGIGIVKQARDYSAAVDFLNYCCEERNNEKLNNWWNTFPVSRNLSRAFTYQNKHFKIYPVATGDLCDFRDDALRVIRRNRKK